MGTPIRVTIRGEAEMNRKIQQLTARVRKEAMVKAVLEGAEIIRADASARAPVRTGFLKAHIDKRVSEKKTGRVVVDIGPTKEAWYGVFPELGATFPSPRGRTQKYRKTRNPYTRPARPYLRPAIDENKDKVVNAVRARLKKEIISAAR